jgi:hypothetical protein
MPRSITCGVLARRPMLAFLRVARAVATLLLPLGGAGCRGSTVEPLTSGLTLRTLPDCAPEQVTRLVVEPLGDFALQEQAALAGDLSQEPVLFNGLPPESQWYRLRVETPDPTLQAFALGRVGSATDSLDALVLPLTRTCSVRDEEFAGFEGSALALAGDEDLLLAGGLNRGGGATRDVRLLHVATRELTNDARGLDVLRTDATGLTLAKETWVLGGASEDREGALAWDTFDRFQAETRMFIGLGRMREPRVLPAALALLDGSVLVAGGLRAPAGEPLTSIESIAADGTDAEAWDSELPFGASELGLFGLDDGSVVAVASMAGESALARIDVGSRGVATLKGPSFSANASAPPALVAALPGERLALVEADATSGETTGSVFIMFEDNTFLKIADPRATSEPRWLASIAGISRGRVLALQDGRLLLTGLRQGRPIARLLDPARRDVSSRALDIAVDRLFLRPDGSALMVGEEGVRILREDAQSAYDNPGGNLLADDSGALCLDAFGRFVREGLGLRATVRGARFDLVPLRYRDVRIELAVEGDAELVLTRADGSQRSIAVGTDSVGPAYCKLSVTAGAPIEIERREERVTLRSDDLSHSCQLDGMSGPIAIGLRALAVDARVSELRVTRL